MRSRGRTCAGTLPVCQCIVHRDPGALRHADFDFSIVVSPTQNGTTTSYTLSVNDRRQTATTGPTGGAASLPLANLHGNIVTNISLPAAGIDGWSDFTQYGSPRDTGDTTAVSGAAGYGWLGAKEHSTTAEFAGLTLMGDRLYNAGIGRFTSPDSGPGGNPTAYTYPFDPINMFDVDGHWGGWTILGLVDTTAPRPAQATQGR